MRTRILSLALALAWAATLLSAPAGADPAGPAEHTLLISVDGLHAVDLANYVKAHPGSALAELSSEGRTYTNATSSKPSDSFPGLLALVTGGGPRTTGIWYDVTFNRKLSPPKSATDSVGNPIPPCSVVGTVVAFDESLDFDGDELDGGASTHGGRAINPANLPRDPSKSCNPVFPHQYVRVNNIFEVLHHYEKRTAWSDKHPSYEILRGPSGNGVDDLFNPEVVSNGDATKHLDTIMTYDDIKVQAVLNEIDGFDHARTKKVGVPTIFGMNFQAVSVGQKLAGSGYTDVLGTPSAGLQSELDFVDHSLGKMVSGLQKNGLLESTLIIITAKHGQSPIDIQKRTAVDDGLPAQIIGAPYAFDLSDDGSVIWLKDQSQTQSVVGVLSQPANQATLGIQEIFAGELLKLTFADPSKDERAPDILLKTNTGVIFTTKTKIAEHGGLNEDDVHVALLVSREGLEPKTIRTPVDTRQVAPTILRALGFDPQALEAVRIEGTKVLPLLFR